MLHFKYFGVLAFVVLITGLEATGMGIGKKRFARSSNDFYKRWSNSHIRFTIPDDALAYPLTQALPSDSHSSGNDGNVFQIETPDSEEVPLFSHIMSRYSLPDAIADELDRHQYPASSKVAPLYSKYRGRTVAGYRPPLVI